MGTEMPPARMLHEHREAFREAVRLAGGKVILLVHPLFEHSATPEKLAQLHRQGDFTAYVERRRRLFEQVKKMLGKRRATTPIIIFEGENKVGSTHPILGGTNPFYVETMGLRDTTTPIPTFNWETLHGIFRDAGVTKILLGGMLSEAQLPSDSKAITQHEKKLGLEPSEIISRMRWRRL